MAADIKISPRDNPEMMMGVVIQRLDHLDETTAELRRQIKDQGDELRALITKVSADFNVTMTRHDERRNNFYEAIQKAVSREREDAEENAEKIHEGIHSRINGVKEVCFGVKYRKKPLRYLTLAVLLIIAAYVTLEKIGTPLLIQIYQMVK